MGFLELMADLVASEYAVKGKRLLEIGADTTLIAARRLIEHGADHVVASNVYDGWNLAASEARIEAVVADACRLDGIADASIDGVFGFNILEHIPNIDDAFAAMLRVLRPGGFCLLHGQPLWTSPHGHHLMNLNAAGRVLSFDSDDKPLPPWAHLYFSSREFFDHFLTMDPSGEAGYRAFDWTYLSPMINRTTHHQMLAAINRSGFVIDSLNVHSEGEPPPAILERLKTSAWWIADEQFGARDFRVNLSKPQPR